MSRVASVLGLAAIAHSQSYVVPNLPFGSSFPMQGTSLNDGTTWQGTVYYGTSNNFNPGAFFAYTNSYNVPIYPAPTPKAPTAPTPPSPHAPTFPTPAPTVSVEGQYCTAYSTTSGCPYGYYCKLKSNYNPFQVGECRKVPGTYPDGAGADMWNQGGGGGGTTNYNGGAGGFPANSNMYNPNGSCKAPSACGFQSLSGSCWCDVDCSTNGDCCGDFSDQCEKTFYVPTESPANVNINYEDDRPDLPSYCLGACETPAPHYHEGKRCFCDKFCLEWNDCCHDYLIHC